MHSFNQRRKMLTDGAVDWSNGSSTLVSLAPGEGEFKFDKFTVGLILTPQPEHFAAYNSDKYKQIPLDAGSFWMFPKGFDGSCQWSDKQEFVNVEIDEDTLVAAGLKIDELTSPRAGEVDPLIRELIFNLHSRMDIELDTYRDSLSLSLAVQLARLSHEPQSEKVLFEPRMQRVFDYIEECLSQKIELKHLADVAALSVFHFSRSFKSACGQTPHQYIATRRIEHAKMLLKTTKLPVSEVSRRVGYHDISRFNRLFKIHTRMTPRDFRTL